MTADSTPSQIDTEIDQPILAEGDAPARIAGFVIDSAILAIASLLVISLLGVLHGPVVEVRGSGELPDRLVVDRVLLAIDSMVVSILAAAYFAGSWVRSGATLGQGWVGLRVLDATGGTAVRVVQAVVRFLALGAPLWLIGGLVSGNARLTVWCLTFIWYAVLVITVTRGSSVSGLHDRIAGTIVVREVRLVPDRTSPSDT